jgi:uncharacterized repeat protein (TIGR02543 family)
MMSSVPQTVQATAKASANSLTQAKKTTAKQAAVVTTQSGLNKALADASITSITIKTSAEKKITIPNKAYKSKTLIVNGAKLTLSNGGLFKAVTITNAKLLTEQAKGNSITINDKKLLMTITSKAAPKSITFAKAGTKSELTVDGTLKKLTISKQANLTLKGKTSKLVPVWIKESAEKTQLTSSLPVTISSDTAAKIILKKGAEKSTVTLTKNAYSISVVNQTSKSISLNTPEGKSLVAVGKTKTTKAQPKPTQPPENEEKPEEGEKPTPTTKPSPSTPGTSDGNTTTYYSVTFDSMGGTLVSPMKLAGGAIIGTLPTPQKNNSVFLGWYTDTGYQSKFTDMTPVNSNLTLYARYSEIETEQQILDDSFSLADQSPALTFNIISTDPSMSAEGVKNALTLTSVDGSEAVSITVTGGSGTYLLRASEGFSEGASYALSLEDNRLNFQNKESNIRKCSFTILKEEVYNIALNEGMIYIPSNEVSNMTHNGTSTQALSVAVVSMSTEQSGDNTASGTFTYHGTRVLKVGDILCVYSGDLPQAPGVGGDDSQYMNDSIAYITVDSVMGEVGNQSVHYTDSEAEEVIFMPDVLPIYAGNGTKLVSYHKATEVSDGAIEIASEDLNFSTFADMGLTSETTVDDGDFIALYTGDFTNASTSDGVSYGEITEVHKDSGVLTISYRSVTEGQMQEVLDYHSKNDVNSDAMLEEIDVAALEKDIEEQVVESGFAEEASTYLTALAMETDGFKNIAGDDLVLESMSIQMPANYEEDLEAMSIMSMSSKISIENLRVNANISKSLQKLSGKGVRCGVTVSFDVPIETGEDKAINISISATFVEEVKLEVDASGKAIWKKKWIFPYIADYQMNANIDLYNYTGISFKAVVSTADTGSTDISEEIQKILSYTKSEQITAGVQELFEIYGEMMENETDWVDIFSQNIVNTDMRLLLGIIHIRTTIDFVVSANVNVALGCNFEYQNGTRYCFWAKIGSKDAGSNQIALMDEKYTFQFYVMGMLGLRAGIRLEFAVGLLTVDLNSIGLTAEAGVYTKLYGFFFYQLESVNKVKNSRTSGALYLDFGIYLEIAFKAQVLNGKYQYNPTLYENEWPLLSAGTRYNVYDFAYPNTKKTIKMKDTVKSYTLPDSTFHMTYLDLREGDISTKNYKISDYNITFSNPNFSLSGNVVKVNVPAGTHLLECDMTVTWKGGPLAFSSLPISRSYYLVWDDINDNGYTITYQTNGGSQISNVTKKYNEKLSEPINPVRAGYTFEGWYSDDQLTAKYSFTTMPAKNLILYAKWTANTNTQYRVEHYHQNLLNDGYTRYSVDTLAGLTDTTVTAVANNFIGFVYDSGVKDTISTGKIAADGSLVLKLYYNRNSYSLTFKPDNGGTDIIKSVKFGAAVSAPTVVKTGYSFQGWDQTVNTTMPAADMTYTARWSPNNYTIRFDSNGGSSVSNLVQSYGTTINAPATPTKQGYLFVGWFNDEALTIPYTFQTMPAGNITLYAKWEISNQLVYKIEHYQQDIDGNGYTLKDTENRMGRLNSVVSADEKSYNGFTYNSTVNETVSNGTVVADGSLVLKLFYDRNSYTLTFKPENGEEDIVTTLKYEATITAPTLSWTGYTFIGWNQTVQSIMPAEDVEYTAEWSQNSYTISFHTNEGSVVADIKQPGGSIVNPPADPVKEGYIFSGWYSNEDLTISYQFQTMPLENITLYAKWIAVVSYKVEHYLQNLNDDAYSLSETENLVGPTDKKVDAVAKQLVGFTLNSEAEGTIDSGNIAGDGSLVLKLYYERNQYTVIFRPENGEEDTVELLKYGMIIIAPTVTRSGYTFAGWNQPVEVTMPAADITYTALWEQMTYSISFETNGGSSVASIRQAAGTPVTPPTDPVRVGYTFLGWYSDSDLMIPYSFEVMPEENLLLYAMWENTTITGDILEAEHATTYGSARIEESEYASGGAHIGYIDWLEGSGVRFDISRQSDVIYLCYSSEETGDINIYINGIKVGSITLAYTGSYIYNYHIVAIKGLNLNSGDTLAIQYDSYFENVAVNVDFIAYTLSNSENIPEVTLNLLNK